MRLALPLVALLLLAGCTGGAPRADDANESTEGNELPPDALACPHLWLVRESETTRVGEAARFVVRIENCMKADIATDAELCYRDTPGVVVNLGVPEGPRALLLPSEEPTPASAEWDACASPAPQATIPAGATVEHRYSWDGRVAPYCPQRLPDQPCEGVRDAAPGAYELAASFAWTQGDRAALTTLVVLNASTPRVPIIVVSENYTKEGPDVELPAQGEGCHDFALTRDPWTATALREAASGAVAVVVREFPQGGFGTFGPDALALLDGQPLAIQSVFEPGRTLGVLEARDGAFFLDGQPLPATIQSGYDTTWNGRGYHVSEVVSASLAGESYLFAGAEQGC